MKEIFSTSEVAKIIGIHPNTVRLYEELKLITTPERKANGYRVFTRLQLKQLKIARLAFEIEVLQNGLRKKAVDIVKATAMCQFNKAMELTETYIKQVIQEKKNAEKAIQIVEEVIADDRVALQDMSMTRKQAADYLNVTIDTLRNWELNGLITVKRKKNGYRVYNEKDIRQLIIINSLRCANYSLASILRMLNSLSYNPKISIREAIDSSEAEDDIITACDNLLTSLSHAQKNAWIIYQHLKELQNNNYYNPPL